MRRRGGSSKEDRDDYGAAIASRPGDPDQAAAAQRVAKAAQKVSTRDMIAERVKLGRAQGHI